MSILKFHKSFFVKNILVGLVLITFTSSAWAVRGQGQMTVRGVVQGFLTVTANNVQFNIDPAQAGQANHANAVNVKGNIGYTLYVTTPDNNVANGKLALEPLTVQGVPNIEVDIGMNRTATGGAQLAGPRTITHANLAVGQGGMIVDDITIGNAPSAIAVAAQGARDAGKMQGTIPNPLQLIGNGITYSMDITWGQTGATADNYEAVLTFIAESKP